MAGYHETTPFLIVPTSTNRPLSPSCRRKRVAILAPSSSQLNLQSFQCSHFGHFGLKAAYNFTPQLIGCELPILFELCAHSHVSLSSSAVNDFPVQYSAANPSQLKRHPEDWIIGRQSLSFCLICSIFYLLIIKSIITPIASSTTLTSNPISHLFVLFSDSETETFIFRSIFSSRRLIISSGSISS